MFSINNHVIPYANSTNKVDEPETFEELLDYAENIFATAAKNRDVICDDRGTTDKLDDVTYYMDDMYALFTHLKENNAFKQSNDPYGFIGRYKYINQNEQEITINTNRLDENPVLDTKTEFLQALMHEMLHARDDVELFSNNQFENDRLEPSFRDKPTNVTQQEELDNMVGAFEFAKKYGESEDKKPITYNFDRKRAMKSIIDDFSPYAKLPRADEAKGYLANCNNNKSVNRYAVHKLSNANLWAQVDKESTKRE